MTGIESLAKIAHEASGAAMPPPFKIEPWELMADGPKRMWLIIAEAVRDRVIEDVSAQMKSAADQISQLKRDAAYWEMQAKDHGYKP